MEIIIFVHPDFLSSKSMPRYANMLRNGLEEAGHQVNFWTAKPYFFNLPFPLFFKKWMGYIDQYLIFPLQIKSKLKRVDGNALFVFADQALGPWVPLVANRNHIIHCHDFLAQQSARGNIKENKVSWTGKIYQDFIKKGYSKGENFISISNKTQSALHSFLPKEPKVSEVVYNGFNQEFHVGNSVVLQKELSAKLGIELTSGFILHVGGNQFYKNREGVVLIYDAWRKLYNKNLPLLMVGTTPNAQLATLKKDSFYDDEIHFLTSINNEDLKELYQSATVLLFPSLAEGFGWPIAEAMASGCPVITTNQAPMTEVGADAAYYIDKKPYQESHNQKWANKAAVVLQEVVSLESDHLQKTVFNGLENAKRFDTDIAILQIEKIYKRIMFNSEKSY